MKISNIKSRQILDSRGNPTVETDIILDDGSFGRASVPSGASTGIHEALELRDNDKDYYSGKSVLNAVRNVNEIIFSALKDTNAFDQSKADQVMIDLDGTENKSNLGANSILSVSLALAHAAANSQNIPLFKYIANLAGYSDKTFELPLPMMNVINGGKHAGWSSDIQEFMIIPKGGKSFSHALQIGVEVFHALGKILNESGYNTTVGDEGGYAPIFKNGNTEAFDMMVTAVEMAGYKIDTDVDFGVDAAASEFYDNGIYRLKNEDKNFNSDEMSQYWVKLIEKYPIVSIEDPLNQDDWKAWQTFCKNIGNKIQLVGDDIFVTNKKFLQRGIDEKTANAILIKVNQIGTLSETISAVSMAINAGWGVIISHRSGETEDTTISHLAVGLGTRQIKTGSLSRTDRVAKYNELLRIEEILGKTHTPNIKSVSKQ